MLYLVTLVLLHTYCIVLTSSNNTIITLLFVFYYKLVSVTSFYN